MSAYRRDFDEIKYISMYLSILIDGNINWFSLYNRQKLFSSSVFKEKKIPECITDITEISSDDSHEENCGEENSNEENSKEEKFKEEN